MQNLVLSISERIHTSQLSVFEGNWSSHTKRK